MKGGMWPFDSGSIRTAGINGILQTLPSKLTINSFKEFDTTPITKEEYEKIKWKEKESKLNQAVLEKLLGYATTFSDNAGVVLLKNLLASKPKQISNIETPSFDAELSQVDTMEKPAAQKLLFSIIEKGKVSDLDTFINLAKEYEMFIPDDLGNNILHLAIKNPNAEMFKQVVEKVNTNVDFDDDAKKKMFNHLNNEDEQKRPIDLLISKDTLITISSTLNNDSLKTLIDNQSNFSNIKNFFTGKIGEITNSKSKYLSNPDKTNILNENEKIYNEALEIIKSKEEELRKLYLQTAEDASRTVALNKEIELINDRRSKLSYPLNTDINVEKINIIWDGEKVIDKSIRSGPAVLGYGDNNTYDTTVTKEEANNFRSEYLNILKEITEETFKKEVIENWPKLTIAPIPTQFAGKRSRKNRRKSKGKTNKK